MSFRAKPWHQMSRIRNPIALSEVESLSEIRPIRGQTDRCTQGTKYHMYHLCGSCSRTSGSVVALSHLFLLGQIGIHVLAQMPIRYQLLQVRLELVTIFGEMAPFTMVGTHGSVILNRRVTWQFWWSSKERFRFNLLKNPIDRLLEHCAVCFEGWSNEITWNRSNSGNLICLSRWFNVW